MVEPGHPINRIVPDEITHSACFGNRRQDASLGCSIRSQKFYGLSETQGTVLSMRTLAFTRRARWTLIQKPTLPPARVQRLVRRGVRVNKRPIQIEVAALVQLSLSETE